MNPETVHLALNFRSTACGTSEDFIDMTQDRSAVTCSACLAPAGTWLAAARQVVATRQHLAAPALGGMLLDLTTASVLVQIHDALNTGNAAKLAAMPLEQAARTAWKLAERVAR